VVGRPHKTDLDDVESNRGVCGYTEAKAITKPTLHLLIGQE
jgi:hypothetical protein